MTYSNDIPIQLSTIDVNLSLHDVCLNIHHVSSNTHDVSLNVLDTSVNIIDVSLNNLIVQGITYWSTFVIGVDSSAAGANPEYLICSQKRAIQYGGAICSCVAVHSVNINNWCVFIHS